MILVGDFCAKYIDLTRLNELKLQGIFSLQINTFSCIVGINLV